MANNINFQFGADASKVDRALEGLAKKIDSIILKGTQSEGVLESAFEKTAIKAEQLQSRIENIGNAFQRMQAQTQLNNLQANLNTGVMDRFITQMNQAGTSTQRTTAQVMQMAQAVGLSRNQLSQIVSAYGAYAASLRIGSEEQINAAANLKILQQTFSELDQSISVSGQNMRTQINNSEAGLRHMGTNLAAIPQQLNEAFSGLNLSRDVIAGSRMFSAVLSQNNNDVLTAIKYIQDYSQTSVEELYRNGAISLEQVKEALAKLRAEISNAGAIDTNNINWMSDAASGIKNATFEKQLSNIAEFEQTLGAKLRSVEDTVINSDEVIKKGFNPFTEIVAKQKMSINELTALIQRLQQTYNNLSPDDKNLKKYELAIQAVTSQLNTSTKGTMGGTLALQQLGFAVGDASQIMTNFRGAIMGVGNNLPFVIQGLMQLRMEVAAINASGAVQTTMWKQLVTSLKGPAGILLAVNLGIALFTMFGDKIGEWTGMTSKAADAAAKFKNELKSATEAATSMSMFQTANIGKSMVEISTLQSLAKEYDNGNTKLTRKKQILAEIQKQNPEIIKSLESQKGAEKSLTKAVEATTKSLYNKLRQQLIEIFLTPEYMKINEAMASYNDESAKLNNMMADPKRNSTQAIDSQIKMVNVKSTAVNKALDQFDVKQQKIQGNVDRMLKKFLGFAGGDVPVTVDDVPVIAGDTGGKGGDTKADEYTTLEKLRNQYAKLIALETDSIAKVKLKIELNQKEYDLIQKTGKTQEEKDTAEVKYLEKKIELEEDLKSIYEDRLSKELDIQKARMARDSKRSEEFGEAFQAEELANAEGMVKLNKLIRDSIAEGATEWEQQLYDLNQEMFDAKADIMANEVMSNELKMSLITATEAKYAKKRIKIEKSIADQKLNMISNLFGAVGSIFSKHTAAYAILTGAQATMDTYAAANVALKSYPPPFNYIAMATAIATGLGNVAQIYENAKPTAYAKGGLVTEPHLGMVGEAGREVIAPERDFKAYSQALLQAGGFAGGGELTATVKGTDLVFVLQKAEKKVNRQKVGGKL